MLTLCSSDKSTHGSIGEGQSDFSFFRQEVEVSLHAVQGTNSEPIQYLQFLQFLVQVNNYPQFTTMRGALFLNLMNFVHQLRHTT